MPLPDSWPQLKDRSKAKPPAVTPAHQPGLATMDAWAKTDGSVALSIGDLDTGNISLVLSITAAAAAGLAGKLTTAAAKARPAP